MRRLIPIGGAALLLVTSLPLPVAAQDWSITRMRPAERTSPTRMRRPRRPPRTSPARPPADRSALLMARYMSVLQADPRETFAFSRLLDLYRERDGNIDALVGELEARSRSDADDWVPHMLLGHIEKARSRPERALAFYREAARLRPDEAAPWVSIGLIEAAHDHHAEARAAFERGLSHLEQAAERREVLRSLGEVALAQGDFDAARGYYDRISAGSGTSVYLRTEYARALAERGEHERAIEEYGRVLRALRGDNRVLVPVLRDLAAVELEAGRPDAAIETYGRALRFAGRTSGVRREILDGLVEAYRRGDRLVELTERLEREGARDFETRQLLGRVYDELGDEEHALGSYRAALRMRPRDIDTRVRVVQLLSRSGRIDDVITEYRSLIRMAPREPRFVVELAQLLAQVGRRDEALRLAAQTGRRHPRDAAVHQQLAELYIRWGETELAEREMATLVRIDPRDPSHLVALGSQQLEQGETEAARATWRRIVAAAPDPAEGHAMLASVLADHDMLDEAEAEYRLAVRARPDEVDHVRGLANVLERPRRGESRALRERRDHEAVELWTRVLEIAGDDRAARREARSRVVGIWSRRRVLSERVRRWQRAFTAEPPDVEAGRFLAEAHLRARPRDLVGATTVLTRIIELEPGDVESLLALERVQTAAGDLPAAIATLERLVDADPRRGPFYLSRMAEHAHTLYRDDAAILYAERAVELRPEDANGHRRLGDLYRARQDMERAVGSYRRALEIDDRLFATFFDLAELHLARAEPAEADELYRRVIRTSPDDDLVARAARASMQLHLGDGSLEVLERELLPLALGHPRRSIYRRLLVELYDSMTAPMIQAVALGLPGAEPAEEELRRLGTRAIKPLLEALADGDPTQRRVAVDLLGYLGNANATGPLLAAAEGQGDGELRLRALLAAGAVAPQRLAPRFAAIAEGRERRLRGAATWSLARMGGRTARARMLDLLASGDPAVQAYAALGLGRAGVASAGASIESLLRESRNSDVRGAAAWALGRLGDEEREASLVAALRGGRQREIRAAAHALGELGSSRGRQVLAEALFSAEPSRRRAAAEALRGLGEAAEGADAVSFPVPIGRALPGSYLDRLIEGRATRIGVAELAALHDPLVEAAGGGLRGPPEVVRATLAMLGGEGRGVILAPLVDPMDERPTDEQDRIEAALSELLEALRVDLIRVTEHPEPDTRRLAIARLGALAGEEVSAALAHALDDPVAGVRREALRAIGERHRSTELVEKVARLATEDDDWTLRLEASRALGRLGGDVAEEALVHVLGHDAYAFVREAAALALDAHSSEISREALGRAARLDVEPRVRAAASRDFDQASRSDD